MNAWHNNWIRKWNERLCSLMEGSQLWPLEHLEWEYVMLKYEMLQFSECAKHDHAKKNTDTIFCSDYTFGIYELMQSVKNMILILLVWMQIYICVLPEWGPFRFLSIDKATLQTVTHGDRWNRTVSLSHLFAFFLLASLPRELTELIGGWRKTWMEMKRWYTFSHAQLSKYVEWLLFYSCHFLFSASKLQFQN